MTNPEGTPIWYELLSADPQASKAFYQQVIGWTVHDAEPGGMDYRMIDTGDGDFAGGLMALSADMQGGGAKPGWLFYIGVDDVDASVTKITAAGGSVRMPAIDLPGVGRMALVADPQGIPFYVMRGASGEASTAFQRTGMAKCNWNELYTPDQAAANAFYTQMFGWTCPDKVPMGDLGDYIFIAVDEEQIGATMTAPPGAPHGWQFYFGVADIDAAAERVKAAGGTVIMGPHEVPGGERVIGAVDSLGTAFGLVAGGAR